MIVVAGGMIRSGSTFAFNIARELLALTGAVESRSTNKFDAADLDLPPEKHLLIKTHAPEPDLLGRIASGDFPCVCTMRRAEDAIASWVRTFGFTVEDGIGMVAQWLLWHSSVRDRVLTIDYDTIDNEPQAAIGSIAIYLGFKLDISVVERLAYAYDKTALKERLDALPNDKSAVDIGFSHYDRQTFFHRRHISAARPLRAEDELDEAQISAIRARLGPR